MSNQNNIELKTLTMDHHGLVAAIGKLLKIEEKVNARLPMQNKKDSLTRGQSVMAMIINGLGFVERRLYMVQNFFQNKPTELLLGKGVTADKINDDILGRTLDAIHDYGETKFFSEIAFEIGLENDAFTSKFARLDTTSVSVEGDYKNSHIENLMDTNEVIISPEDKIGKFSITHGYSKDHRPDLKQFVLSLTTSGPADFPVWMEALSGNSSDKENFIHTIKKANKLQQELKRSENFIWIADAALYTKSKLLSEKNLISWITRVPETINEAKDIIQLPTSDLQWTDLKNGYSISPILSNYGEVEQRWIIVFSQKAFENEINTIDLMIEKKELLLKKAIKKMEKTGFHCAKDAETEFDKFKKNYSLFKLESTIISKIDRKRKGNKDKDKVIENKYFNYEIKYEIETEEILKLKNSRGRFILATNVLDVDKVTDSMILSEYKNQSKVENGFKFIKDSSFFAADIYLKTPSRISALMVVVMLCLMIYNVGQFHIRQILEKNADTIPNQLKKPIKNPTLKWIFQCFRGISIVQFIDQYGNKIKEFVTNLTELHKKIIRYFGELAMNIFNLNGETNNECTILLENNKLLLN